MPDVLITGASGFSGSALSARLSKEQDLRLFAISRKTPPDSSLFVKTFRVDLDDEPSADEILSEVRPTWILHLAGKLKGDLPELMQANFTNTLHLLEAARQFAPRARILLIGSAAEYGNPGNCEAISEASICKPETPYGLSKYAMTLLGLHYAAAYNLQINIARTFNLIGPGIPPTVVLGAVIQRAREAMAVGRDTISVGDLSAERDFVDVRDAAGAYLTIMKSKAVGEIFNVCSGVPVKIEDAVKAILSKAPVPLQYKIDPALGSKGAPRVIGNPSKLKSLGFTPHFSFFTTLAEMPL